MTFKSCMNVTGNLEVKTNADLRQFLDTLEIVNPLQPRNAFFGGRTNAVKLHHVANQEEEIEYIEVTSLYPWVNKTQEYPVFHPQVIVNPDDQDIHHYFGMAKVDILPSYELYHPVLPHRLKGKLTFLLCQASMEEEMGNPPLGKIVPLSTHPRDTQTQRGMVHSRDPQSRRTGVHRAKDPRRRVPT